MENNNTTLEKRLQKFDIAKIRNDFPILHQQINGHPLTYLDNAATTQKPKVVIDAIRSFYETMNSNVHRSVHTLSERATQAYEGARESVQRFINAKDFREIIFTRGTTESINLVANSFVKPRVGPGDVIIVTHMEHHSNIVPWQMICSHTGAAMRAAPVLANGECDLDALKKLLREEASFLAISHVSNAIGTINPLKEIIEYAHQNNVLVCVDGAQGAAHLQVDVQDLDADFYAFSGHKMYGPTGIGVLYGKYALLEEMVPYQGGGEMISHVSFEKTEYAPLPAKFEAGTPNVSGAIALRAAIGYLKDIGMDLIEARENALLAYAREKMSSLHGVALVGTAKSKVPIISFVVTGVHPHDVGTILNSMGVAIRAGHHCAMPLMDFFGIAGTSRVSLSFYNTEEEIDHLVQAILKVREVVGHVRPT